MQLLNVLKSTESEIISNGPSKLHVSSIILSIELLLVYFDEGQEGLLREQNRYFSPLRKTCLKSDRIKGEKGI